MASITAFLFILTPFCDEGISFNLRSSSHSDWLSCNLLLVDFDDFELVDLRAFFIGREERQWGEGPALVVLTIEGEREGVRLELEEGRREEEAESNISLVRLLLVGIEDASCINRLVGVSRFFPRGGADPPSLSGVGTPTGMTLRIGMPQVGVTVGVTVGVCVEHAVELQ